MSESIHELVRRLAAEIRREHNLPDSCPVCTGCRQPVVEDDEGRWSCACFREDEIDEPAEK